MKKYAVSKGNRRTTKLATGGGRAHILAGSWQYGGCSL